ncbi:(2Fe-2S)-binding protein [Nocardioides sp. SOB77]|uniref:(2Fe-2S)-binding protein n=1 Tax=Nocardioides oceani TaxID=3058369 RepID=A0ABT8FCE5_9ACTN|nr:(2Fe-2S)-binding protein [Nocardioides oceani]MDN4172357.1 (2Fe-2S)-binding protein [Nocardioides oceani]
MSATPQERLEVSISINGRRYKAPVEARKTLADFIREDAHLTGTKLGCEHGVCGSCTVLIDDAPARSCLTLAAQADGHRVRTVESLTEGQELNGLQRAFREQHGLQCGFCTAGFLMTATALLEENPTPTRDDIVETVSGSLCRCTGYQTIIAAIEQAAAEGAADTQKHDEQEGDVL